MGAFTGTDCREFEGYVLPFVGFRVVHFFNSVQLYRVMVGEDLDINFYFFCSFSSFSAVSCPLLLIIILISSSSFTLALCFQPRAQAGHRAWTLRAQFAFRARFRLASAKQGSMGRPIQASMARFVAQLVPLLLASLLLALPLKSQPKLSRLFIIMAAFAVPV